MIKIGPQVLWEYFNNFGLENALIDKRMKAIDENVLLKPKFIKLV